MRWWRSTSSHWGKKLPSPRSRGEHGETNTLVFLSDDAERREWEESKDPYLPMGVILSVAKDLLFAVVLARRASQS